MGKVIGIIGARLNSSRLPGKHLLDLAGQPLIARIFQRLESIVELDHIVLATTADDYNKPLVHWAQQSGKAVFAYTGDVNDVVGRVDAVVQNYDATIVVYICGDSPLIDPDTVDKMIRALKDNPSAEYVQLIAQPSAGKPIHEGFYPYPISTWRKLVEHSTTAADCEHVGSALKKFLYALKTVSVLDEPVFSRLEHRISVDTPSDYRFMSEVYRRWYAHQDNDTIVSLPWVIEQVASDETLRRINRNVHQKQVGERSLQILLLTHCGYELGLGHLKRCILLAHALQDQCAAGVEIVILGESIAIPGLELIPHCFLQNDSALEPLINERLETVRVNAVVFDYTDRALPSHFDAIVRQASEKGLKTIAIDGLFDYSANLDLICVPSFYLAHQYQDLAASGKVVFGWDKYFVPSARQSVHRPGRQKVLVLTGGSDVYHLGESWPQLLEKQLPAGSEVIWIRGPYAAAPTMPVPARLQWRCIQSPDNLDSLMDDADFALTVYGVTLFELLKRGIPTVTYTPSATLQDEVTSFKESNVALVTQNVDSAIDALYELLTTPRMAQRLSLQAIAKMGESDGASYLANRIQDMIGVEE